jgi:hypothetical protein
MKVNVIIINKNNKKNILFLEIDDDFKFSLFTAPKIYERK